MRSFLFLGLMSLLVFSPRWRKLGFGQTVLLDAYIAMIPKTDGDATPLARGLFVCSRTFIVLGSCSYGSA